MMRGRQRKILFWTVLAPTQKENSPLLQLSFSEKERKEG